MAFSMTLTDFIGSLSTLFKNLLNLIKRELKNVI